MKVIHIVNSLKIGGAEMFLTNLSNHLKSLGIDVHVCCLFNKGPLINRLKTNDIPVKCLYISRKPRMNNLYRVFLTLRFDAFDIVHCHLPEASWYGALAGWLARIPVRIVHLQNTHWYWKLKLRVFDRLLFKFADAAFSCSKAVLNFYTERVWYPKDKLYLVYNSIDPQQFVQLPDRATVRSRLGLDHEHLILTTVASLTPQKGHINLLQSFRNIVAIYPNTRLVLVGEGPLRCELQEVVRSLGLERWVYWFGERLDVPEILQASDIFILPSLWEGLPMVLVEASFVGLPVVASNVGGIPEVIEDGGSGFLVPPGDIDSLTWACIRLIENPELRRKMGERGKTIAYSKFNIRRTALHVVELYEFFLNKKKPSRC